MPSKARIRAAIVALAVPAVILAGTPASASEGQTTISRCWLEHEDGSTYLYASVAVQNNEPNAQHSYDVDIVFNTPEGTRLGHGTTSVYDVAPLEAGENEPSNPVVTDPSASATDVEAGDVACESTTKDDEGEVVDRQQWEQTGETSVIPPSTKEQQGYTVVSGDTLSGIAEEQCGDASRWTEIYNTNRDTIESTARDHGRPGSDHGHWIYPGTDLVITCQ
jgi:nucleoid-associated protein YgaU